MLTFSDAEVRGWLTLEEREGFDFILQKGTFGRRSLYDTLRTLAHTRAKLVAAQYQYQGGDDVCCDCGNRSLRPCEPECFFLTFPHGQV